MSNLGTLLVVLAVLVAAVAAVRRDPRFTTREIWLQTTVTLASAAGPILVLVVLLALLEDREPGLVGTVVAVWFVLALVEIAVLARFLKRRLDRRSRDDA